MPKQTTCFIPCPKSTAYIDLKAIKDMSRTVNYRGLETSWLVVQMQWLKDNIGASVSPKPKSFEGTEEEWYSVCAYRDACEIGALNIELLRRRKMDFKVPEKVDKAVIQTIKERVTVADILSEYTDVFYQSPQTWRFRCTLHGVDSDPAGRIYNDTKQWHCYACGAHGDVIDAVAEFGRVSKSAAIGNLCRRLGIKPSQQKRDSRYTDYEL